MWSRIAEQKDEVFDCLIAPNMGDAQYMWTDYCDIKKGCSEVTYATLDHYQDVTGVNLTPIEAGLMIDIDLIRRKNG